MRRRILSVGYNRAGLTLRNWVLERAGYEVLPANSKTEAVQLLQFETCDLIVIAGNLDRTDILEIVSASARRTPILWMFVGSREDVPGISAYMPLLDGPEELLNNIRRLLVEPMPVAGAHLEGERERQDWRGLKSPYLVFADGKRRLIEMTEQVCKLLGYERAELLRMTVDEITAPGTAEVPEMFAKLVEDGFQEGSYILKHRSGKQIPIRYRAKVFPDGCMAAEWYPSLEKQAVRSRRRA